MSGIESNLKALDKVLISRALKNVLYILPMLLLSHKIYLHCAGNDVFLHVGFDVSRIISNLNFSATIYAVVFFCLLFILTYTIETTFLPMVIIAFCGELKIDTVEVGLEKAGDHLVKAHGFNGLKYFFLLSRDEVFKKITFAPITVILWMIYIK